MKEGLPDTGGRVAPATRKSMSANRAKHTKPELAVRSTLHAMGYRFRLHVGSLPGTPDVVFPARRKVIWISGCFWHSHAGCRFATIPKTRTEFWVAKLTRNKERDKENSEKLANLGWKDLVVWECELGNMAALRLKLREFLGEPRASRENPP